jgi:phosphoenolpyruvate synthase/pyruvate phosphate dikinase
LLKKWIECTKVLKDNPFASIDQEGVGQLVAGAVEKGRKTNPELSVGVCGEHGGDPDKPFSASSRLMPSVVWVRSLVPKLKKSATSAILSHIMIPLVFTPIELETHRRIVQQAIDEEFESAGTKVDVKIGTMIELPRAALVADRIAEVADFFSLRSDDGSQARLG